MKKVILILFLLLNSCNKSVSNNEVINFDNNISFEEFKTLLKKYSDNTQYPNIE